MIQSLTLKNFQAWDNVSIPLSPITVIIGETNAGKSSLLRALASVLFNAMEGQGMVRHGASVAEVTLETDDNHVITWSRGLNVNRYVLDGHVYDKPGRVVPLPVQDALQIHELEFDGETVRLQWAPQMDAPFLLSDSGVKATRMLGVAGNAAVVAQAARLAQQEVKGRQDDLRAASNQLASLTSQLEAFGDLTVAETLAVGLRLALQSIAELADRRRALQDVHDRHLATQPRRQAVARHLTAAQTLIDRLQRLEILQGRRRMLAEGQVVGQRKSAVSDRLQRATALTERHQALVRSAEIQALFAAYIAANAERSKLQECLDQATVNLSDCRTHHERLLADMTCPTCGRVKDSA